MPTNTTPKGGTSVTHQTRMPNIPTNLTKEISTFDQLQERILALGNHYNASSQLCSAVGSLVAPGNGGAPIWYAKIWLFNGNQQVAEVTGPVLDTVINRAIEDAAYTLASMMTTSRTTGKQRDTSGLKEAVGS